MLSYLESISNYVLLFGILEIYLLRSLIGNASLIGIVLLTTFSYLKCISNYVFLLGMYFVLRSLIGNVFLTTFIYCECISHYVLLYMKCISNYVLLMGMFFLHVTSFYYWECIFLPTSLVENVFLTSFLYWECISYYVL